MSVGAVGMCGRRRQLRAMEEWPWGVYGCGKCVQRCHLAVSAASVVTRSFSNCAFVASQWVKGAGEVRDEFSSTWVLWETDTPPVCQASAIPLTCGSRAVLPLPLTRVFFSWPLLQITTVNKYGGMDACTTHSLCRLPSRLLLLDRLQPARPCSDEGLGKAPHGGVAQDAAIHLQDGGADVLAMPHRDVHLLDRVASLSWTVHLLDKAP